MADGWKDPIGVEALRRQIARLEQSRFGGGATFSSGCGPLDRLLPGGGFRGGSLVEWVAAGEGSGAATLAFVAAGSVCRGGGGLVVLDPRREFYPLAAMRLKIDPRNLVVVQADDPADYRWALDQSLRCRGVAAVVAWPERLDGHTFRRLQLAAEEGGGLGFLVRPPAARQEPSWAEVRLLVEPRSAGTLAAGSFGGQCPGPVACTAGQASTRRLRVELLRCRGGVNGQSIDLEIDDETHTVYLAAPLADPAAAARAAGA